MAKKNTENLFAEASGLAVSQVLAGKVASSKAHQAFRKLLQKVEARRAELAVWRDYAERHQQRLAAEFTPLQREIATEQRRMALFFDEVLRASSPGARWAGCSGTSSLMC